jgi:hypothetical protein
MQTNHPAKTSAPVPPHTCSRNIQGPELDLVLRCTLLPEPLEQIEAWRFCLLLCEHSCAAQPAAVLRPQEAPGCWLRGPAAGKGSCLWGLNRHNGRRL